MHFETPPLVFIIIEIIYYLKRELQDICNFFNNFVKNKFSEVYNTNGLVGINQLIKTIFISKDFILDLKQKLYSCVDDIHVFPILNLISDELAQKFKHFIDKNLENLNLTINHNAKSPKVVKRKDVEDSDTSSDTYSDIFSDTSSPTAETSLDKNIIIERIINYIEQLILWERNSEMYELINEYVEHAFRTVYKKKGIDGMDEFLEKILDIKGSMLRIQVMIFHHVEDQSTFSRINSIFTMLNDSFNSLLKENLKKVNLIVPDVCGNMVSPNVVECTDPNVFKNKRRR